MAADSSLIDSSASVSLAILHADEGGRFRGNVYPSAGPVQAIRQVPADAEQHRDVNAARSGEMFPDLSYRSITSHPKDAMQIFDGIISDRGSKYAVSGGACSSPDEARVFVKALCRKKKFAKATHNTWAFVGSAGPVKNDDGEAGAGMVIARMLEREGVQNHIVVVTRWYGGKHLGGDRFRHVQNAVRHYLDNRSIDT